MAPDRLRKQLTMLPFRPLTVELASGKRIHVEHPDFAALSPAGRTLVVFHRETDFVEAEDDGAMEIIDVFLISNLSVEGGSKAAA
jgi:hypothetical protein